MLEEREKSSYITRLRLVSLKYSTALSTWIYIRPSIQFVMRASIKQIEIGGLSIDWFQNYLNERKQCDAINGCHFSRADVVFIISLYLDFAIENKKLKTEGMLILLTLFSFLATGKS